MADTEATRRPFRSVVTFSDERGGHLTEAQFMARRTPDNYRMICYFEEGRQGGTTGYFLAYLLPECPPFLKAAPT